MILHEIDVKSIRTILAEFTIDKCKIVLQGNQLFDASKSSVELPEPISKKPEVDKWFGTKFRLYKKPEAEDLKETFETNEWQDAVKNFETKL